jgi:hypothetical protein
MTWSKCYTYLLPLSLQLSLILRAQAWATTHMIEGVHESRISAGLRLNPSAAMKACFQFVSCLTLLHFSLSILGVSSVSSDTRR